MGYAEGENTACDAYENWDQATAQNIVDGLLALKNAVGYSDDDEQRQRQFEAVDAVDLAWLEKHIVELRRAADKCANMFNSDRIRYERRATSLDDPSS